MTLRQERQRLIGCRAAHASAKALLRNGPGRGAPVDVRFSTSGAVTLTGFSEFHRKGHDIAVLVAPWAAKWFNRVVSVAGKVGGKPTFLLHPGMSMPAVEKSGLIERITELGEQAAAGTAIEIAEVQLRGAGKARLLRIYIDKPGGVTHGDCELISQKLGKLLDEGDVIPGDSYTLEVSSPGVERSLLKPRDFERVIGQKIRLAVREPIEGQTRFEGKLAQFSGETLDVEISLGRLMHVPLQQVQKANLKFEW